MWEADVSAGMLREFAFDEHDKKTALEDIVGDIGRFKPVLQAVKQRAGGYTADDLLKALRLEADIAFSESGPATRHAHLTTVPSRGVSEGAPAAALAAGYVPCNSTLQCPVAYEKRSARNAQCARSDTRFG